MSDNADYDKYDNIMDADLCDDPNQTEVKALYKRIEQLEFQVRQERHKGEINAMVFLEKLNAANVLIDRAIDADKYMDADKAEKVIEDMRKEREGK